MNSKSACIEPVAQYQRSGLKDKDIPNITGSLIEYMRESKPYLRRDLSIHDLSKEIDIPKHYITQVLNKHLCKNFNAFINEYRIEEFKSRLLDPRYRNYTIIAIAFESGFNSKTSFNILFKKYERMTPSEYRENLPGGDTLH